MSAEGRWWGLVTTALRTNKEPTSDMTSHFALEEEPLTERSQADTAGMVPNCGCPGHLHVTGNMPLFQWKKDVGELPGAQWFWIFIINQN